MPTNYDENQTNNGGIMRILCFVKKRKFRYYPSLNVTIFIKKNVFLALIVVFLGTFALLRRLGIT